MPNGARERLNVKLGSAPNLQPTPSLFSSPDTKEEIMDGMNRNERDLDDAALRRADSNRLDDKVAGGDTVGTEVGEAAGGISGVLAGAAIGSLGGPLGTIIGGLAGAVSGWWAGRAIAEAAQHITHDDDTAFRSHYESSTNRLADRSYDDVRPAYQLGHLASRNPDYANRDFNDIESDLRAGWTDDVRSRYGEWDSVRGYARDAYDRGRTGAVGATGAAVAGSAAYGAGRVADGAADLGRDVKHGAAEVGHDVKHGAAELGHDVKQGAENAWDATKRGAEKLGDKVADGADDMKDRVDGNPASRPGPDSTDRPGR